MHRHVFDGQVSLRCATNRELAAWWLEIETLNSATYAAKPRLAITLANLFKVTKVTS